MLRSIDDPNEAFTRVEFASVEDAKEFRDRLVASRALSDAATVLTPPTVVEMVENISYSDRGSIQSASGRTAPIRIPKLMVSRSG
jgi:hypothetical protein